MTLQQRLEALINLFATDVVALQTSRGNLSALTTASKASLVAAVNELKAAIDTIAASGAGIDDSAGAGNTTATWSANKILSQINSAFAALVGSAPEALDTLEELASALAENASGITALLGAISNKVDYASVQALTPTQQKQACENVGVGDPDFDLAAYYTAAKA